MSVIIQHKRGTASQWTSLNPTLEAGEVGWESDTNMFKIGTGTTDWNSLGYATLTPSGLSSTYAQLAGGNAFTGAQTVTSTAVGQIPLVLRGASGQTANLLELQNSGGGFLAGVLSNGGIRMQQARINSASSLGTLTAVAETSGTIGAVIRGAASQTASLQEWQNSSGVVLAKLDSVGDMTASVFRGTRAARFTTNDATIAIQVNTGIANQVGDHFQMQNSAGTVLGGTTANGLLYIGSSSPIRLLNYTITAASASSTSVASFTSNTVSTVNPVVVGQKVVVSGMTPTSYNGTFNVTAIGGVSGAWTMTVAAPTSPFVVGSATGFGTYSLDASATIQTLSAGSPGLIIRAVASQAANIFEYRRSDNSLQTYITPAGDFIAPAISAIWSITSSAQDVTVNAMRARTSLASGYRANLQTWESSTTVLAGVNSPGKFFTGSTIPLSTAVGGTIQSIATGANPLVTMASAHGLAVGEVVTLAGTTGATYDGSFYVASVPASTTFTITSVLTAGQVAAGGTVSLPAQSSITSRSTGTTGLIIRSAASQTANLTEWQNSSATVQAYIDASYNIRAVGAIALGNLSLGSGLISGQTTSASQVGAVIRGAASQTADLQQWQNSAGTVQASVSPFGVITSGQNVINAVTSTVVPLLVKANASGSMNLQEWQNSAGTILARVAASGSFLANSLQTLNGLAVTSEESSGASMRMSKLTAVGVNPGAGWGKLYFRDGTNAGTLRLATITGASGIEETIVDNISSTGSTAGARFTGAGGVVTTGTLTSAGLTLSSTTSPITLNGSVGTSGQVLTSAGAGATPTWTTVSGGSFTGGTLTSNLTLAAGTTSLSPLTFQSGTNLTTVTAGANEYDGTVFYQTSATTPGRALKTQDYYYATPSAGFTLPMDTNTTSSILGGVGTGITLLAGTTYEVELLVNFQHIFGGDATRTFTQSWNASTVSGTPTVSWNYTLDFGSNTTSFATATSLSSVLINAPATAVSISASIAAGSRYVIYKAKGVLRITGTGSIKFYPVVSVNTLLVNNTAVIGAGSYFKLTPIGNGTVTTVGTWA